MLKVLLISNTIAFFPFTVFYIIPEVLFGQYIYSAIVTAPFLIIIPLALVYQFVVNKIYDIDFLLGRIRYYGFLSIIPTIGVVWLNILFDSKGNNFNIIQITVYVFLIFLAVFYIKELLDYKFRLKRFSENIIIKTAFINIHSFLKAYQL